MSFSTDRATGALKKSASRAVQSLGSSIFATLAARKAQLIASGVRVYDLSIGSPDLPPVRELIDEMSAALTKEDAFQYPSSKGKMAFCEAAARWMDARFGVSLDPASEICSLIGTQDGLAHLAQAIGDAGDLALVPDPGYPIHLVGPLLAGMDVYRLPLCKEHGFLPDLEAVPEDVRTRAVMMILSYPSNPTAAVATRADMEKWVDFCRANGIVLVHDLAYSEMAFDGFDPPSILSIPNAMDVAVEFHSLSKSFNLAGSRIGFIAGNRAVVRSLQTLKENIDYGVFHAVQDAGIAALSRDLVRIGNGEPPQAAQIYAPRRDLLVGILQAAGWDMQLPQATMFVWAPVPEGIDSARFAACLLEATGVVVVPGNAFGANGEGFVRIALVQPEADIREAAERMAKFWREKGWLQR